MHKTQKQFQKYRNHCLTGLAAASLLIGLAGPARADLEAVAKSLPQDAVGAVSVDLQPSTWDFFLKQPTLKKWLMSDDFAAMDHDLKSELGIDANEVMAAFGSYGMVAFFPPLKGSEDPEAFLSIEMKSLDPIKKAIANVKAKKDNAKFHIENYKGTDLIVENPEADTKDSVAKAMVMGLQGNKLLMSVGLDRMKKQLDLGDKSQGLMANPSFKPVYQALGKEPVMVWVDLKSLKSAMAEGMKDLTDELGPLAMFQEGMVYNNSLGIGLRMDAQGLMVKNLLGYAKDGLTGSQQAYLVKLTTRKGPSNDSLLAMMPEQPLFSTVSNGLTLAFENPALSGGITKQKSDTGEDTAQMMLDILDGVKKTTGLDLNQDILAHSDGRIGMTSFYLEHYPSYEQLPHFVALLGVKDGQAFMANLQQKLKLHLEALDKGDVNPKAQPAMISKQALETYKGVAIYRLEGGEELTKLNQEVGKELKSEILPSVAIVNQVFVLGDSPEAVRATIDYSQQSRKSLLNDENFKQIRSRMNGKDEAGLFYGDLTRWYRLADNFLHGETWFKAAAPLFASFKAIAGDSAVDSEASKGHFLFDANLKSVDFAKLEANFQELEDLDKVSSVETNMANAKTMIQNYHQKMKGQLPRNAAQLMGAAQGQDMLSSNPFTQGLGVGSKPGDKANIMDFYTWKSFKPSPELGGLVLIDNIYGKRVLIYGTDKQGELIKHNDKVFFLEVLPK